MTVVFELVDHPPYSSDLAPSDYFLFPNMKKPHLAGKYRTDDEVISAAEDFIEEQDESLCTGLQALGHALIYKCVDRRGSGGGGGELCVEKKINNIG